MDLIIDLLVLIAVIYGVAQKAKKDASREKGTSPYLKKARANQKSFLNRNETKSDFGSFSDEEWRQYEKNISAEFYETQQENSLYQEIQTEEMDVNQSETQVKNTIGDTQIVDSINKSEIGNLKLSFHRNKIIEAWIMAEILGKPKALKK